MMLGCDLGLELGRRRYSLSYPFDLGCNLGFLGVISMTSI